MIGIFAPNEDVARMAFFGLFALQHRGQEAAGIAVSDGRTMRLHKDIGLVSQVFNPQNLAPLHGRLCHRAHALFHHRLIAPRNAQPFMIETHFGPLAVAHNGNLVNSAELRQELLQHGVGLSPPRIREVITMMLAGVGRRHLGGAHPQPDAKVGGRITRWSS